MFIEVRRVNNLPSIEVQAFSLEDLPNEIIAHICSFCMKMFAELRCVSKKINAISLIAIDLDGSAKRKVQLIQACLSIESQRDKTLPQYDPIDLLAEDNLAIRYASANGHYKIVRDLLKNEQLNPRAKNDQAILSASAEGHYKVVQELMRDDRVDPSAEYNSAIRNASANGHYKVVRELLKDRRVDPSVGNNFAIRHASENGHYKVVRELLKDERVDPLADDNYALCMATSNGHKKVIHELKKHQRSKRII